MPLGRCALIHVLLQHMFYSEVVNCLNIWYSRKYQIKRWCLKSIVFWLWYQNHGPKSLIHDVWNYLIRLKSSFDSSSSADRNQVLRWRPGVLVRLWWFVGKCSFSICMLWKLKIYFLSLGLKGIFWTSLNKILGLTDSGGVVSLTLNLSVMVITLYKLFYQNIWFCHHQKGADCKSNKCFYIWP